MDTGTTSSIGPDTSLRALESTVLTAIALPKGTVEPARHACLVVLFGAEIGRRIELEGKDVVIGRASSADLQLDSDSVSRTHAVVSRTSSGFIVRDQESTNGTFVNDQPVRERALKDGDQVRIGRAMLKFLTSSNVEAQYHEEIYRLMTVDGLTQVYNRRYFQEAVEREFARSRRYQHPFVLVLLDIDHFKHINDRYGHQAGDTVLRKVGALLKTNIRTNDLAARIGGEEFAVILPETRGKGGHALAEKLRRIIAGETFVHGDDTIMATVSLGVAEFSAKLDSPEALIKLADERLYGAKNSGRNRVL
ncbi:MAG: domain/GGDEF domain protein [Myxococcaceae bacterium]|nr:domain/GGDEF domain protein [Myxococcaceae bacterium]